MGVQEHKAIMPDLNCAQVQDATIKIQSAYRGFKTRKEMKEAGEDLPDLEAADVAAATVKIQSAYKGFRVRQDMKKKKEAEEAEAKALEEKAKAEDKGGYSFFGR